MILIIIYGVCTVVAVALGDLTQLLVAIGVWMVLGARLALRRRMALGSLLTTRPQSAR